MRTKFERIFKLMQDYVDFSVNTRAEINKINADMNISQKRSGWPLFFKRLLLTGLLAGRLVLPVLVLFFLSAIISPL